MSPEQQNAEIKKWNTIGKNGVIIILCLWALIAIGGCLTLLVIGGINTAVNPATQPIIMLGGLI
jgi:hypothetical protein